MAGKTNAELQAELDNAKTEIERLSTELTHSRADLAAAQTAVAQGEKDLSEALALISQQNEALTKDDTHTDSVVVTVDKKKYRVNAHVINVGGKEVTAAELKENKELAAKLVAKGSGILQLLG